MEVEDIQNLKKAGCHEPGKGVAKRYVPRVSPRPAGFQIGYFPSSRENTDRTLCWGNGEGGTVLWDRLWTYWVWRCLWHSTYLKAEVKVIECESSTQRGSQDRSSLELSVHESSGHGKVLPTRGLKFIQFGDANHEQQCKNVKSGTEVNIYEIRNHIFSKAKNTTCLTRSRKNTQQFWLIHCLIYLYNTSLFHILDCIPPFDSFLWQ